MLLASLHPADNLFPRCGTLHNGEHKRSGVESRRAHTQKQHRGAPMHGAWKLSSGPKSRGRGLSPCTMLRRQNPLKNYRRTFRAGLEGDACPSRARTLPRQPGSNTELIDGGEEKKRDTQNKNSREGATKERQTRRQQHPTNKSGDDDDRCHYRHQRPHQQQMK